MQEVFYEESAKLLNERRAKIRFVLLTVFMWLSILAALAFLLLIFLGDVTKPVTFVFPVIGFVLFVASAIFYYRKRDSFYLDFDYTFVTGSVRIAKVIRSRRRRSIILFEASELLGAGRAGSDTYERIAKSPDVKKIIASANDEPDEGKGFYYLYLNGPTLRESRRGKPFKKKLIVLECTETLMVHILKFAPRGVLEKDFK